MCLCGDKCFDSACMTGNECSYNQDGKLILISGNAQYFESFLKQFSVLFFPFRGKAVFHKSITCQYKPPCFSLSAGFPYRGTAVI